MTNYKTDEGLFFFHLKCIITIWIKALILLKFNILTFELFKSLLVTFTGVRSLCDVIRKASDVNFCF